MKTCKRGHVSEVNARGECKACCALRNAAYYEKNRDRLLEKGRQALRSETPEQRQARLIKAKARVKEWIANNPEKRAEQRAKYDGNDAARARKAAWKKRNPAAVSKSTQDRNAKKLRATPSWANEFFIEEAYRLAKLREKVCGGRWHVDHAVPLRSKMVCGLHVEHNLQVIPRSANTSKSNRWWPDMPGAAS